MEWKLQIPIKYNSRILFLCNNRNQIYLILREESISYLMKSDKWSNDDI